MKLVDYLDVTREQVQEANPGGVGCICKLCGNLKELEDTWIMSLATFFHPGGLCRSLPLDQQLHFKNGDFEIILYTFLVTIIQLTYTYPNHSFQNFTKKIYVEPQKHKN